MAEKTVKMKALQSIPALGKKRGEPLEVSEQDARDLQARGVAAPVAAEKNAAAK